MTNTESKAESQSADSPVLCEADVIVAGGGIAGIFAALSAAREGANTVLVERFASIGGNYGPGLGSRHDFWQHPSLQQRGPGGVVSEFLEELTQTGGVKGFEYLKMTDTEGMPGAEWGWNDMPPLPVIDHETFAYLALKKLNEAGVTLLLDTQIIDTIMDGNRVTGVVVFGKQGLHKLPGKVFIDCSGDSIVALKAGATLEPAPTFSNSGSGLFFKVAGVDWDTFTAFHKEAMSRPHSKEDRQWLEDVMFAELGTSSVSWLKSMLPFVRKAWEAEEYHYVQDCDGLAKLYLVPFGVHDQDTAVVQYGPNAKVDMDNPVHMSKLMAKSRMYIYESVAFLRKYAPGFDNGRIDQISSYLGSRYGKMFDSVFTYDNDDIWEGREFDDSVYRLSHLYKNWSGPGKTRKLVDLERREEGVEYEIPYRILIAKNVEGLMAAGRNVNSNPQSRLRGRWITMVTGAIAGIAASMASSQGILPRHIDIRSLQRALVTQGYNLGNGKRLEELGLA
jgi:hypothetical protein